MEGKKWLIFKFTILVCIFLFWLLGMAILGIGIWILKDNYISFLASDLNLTKTVQLISGLFIASGCIVIIVGFVGVCGVLGEQRCLLLIYAIVVGIVFMLEVSAGGYVYDQRTEIETTLTDTLKNFTLSYWENDAARNAMTFIQSYWLDCCGVNGSMDYGKLVPQSCAYHPEVGCKDKLVSWFGDNIPIFGAVGISVAVIQLLAVVLSIILIVMIGKEMSEKNAFAPQRY